MYRPKSLQSLYHCIQHIIPYSISTTLVLLFGSGRRRDRFCTCTSFARAMGVGISCKGRWDGFLVLRTEMSRGGTCNASMMSREMQTSIESDCKRLRLPCALLCMLCEADRHPEDSAFCAVLLSPHLHHSNSRQTRDRNCRSY